MIKKILRRALKVFLAVVILGIILVCGGVIYIWFSGQQEPVAQVQDEPTPVSARPNTTPTAISPDAAVSISGRMISSPLAPGDTASITVKTNPEATCVITMTYGKPGEEDKQSAASGLADAVADIYGVVEWEWQVEDYRPEGKWPVEITCKNPAGSKSGYYREYITVKA